jgi:hypothetical protein
MTNSKPKETLIRAQEIASRCASKTESEVTALARSNQVSDRLVALMIMQTRASEHHSIRPYLDTARRLIHDADNNCRWQALILVGEGIAREPELVWEVISEEGSFYDDDMRMGVATILLEHLLNEHFEDYFPLVCERVLSGDEHFAKTVKSCWISDPTHKKRVENLLRNGKRGQS